MRRRGLDPGGAALPVERARGEPLRAELPSNTRLGGCCSQFEVHHAVLGRDRYILENLLLTTELPARGASVIVAPLNVAGAPEAPARVWALLG